MSTPRAQLLQEANRLAEAWIRFRTPGTRQPVDPAIPNQILRFLRSRPKVSEVRDLLDALPHSSVARLTASSGPQVTEVVGRCKPLLEQVARGATDAEAVEALATVLGWAIRLLQNEERGAAPPR